MQKESQRESSRKREEFSEILRGPPLRTTNAKSLRRPAELPTRGEREAASRHFMRDRETVMRAGDAARRRVDEERDRLFSRHESAKERKRERAAKDRENAGTIPSLASGYR
jgi:hypothetical protein